MTDKMYCAYDTLNPDGTEKHWCDYYLSQMSLSIQW